MTEQELKLGRVYTYLTPDGDREAEVSFDDANGWSGGFKIWFNGAYIHHTKTFKPMQKRLDTLIEKWNLVEVNDVLEGAIA